MASSCINSLGSGSTSSSSRMVSSKKAVLVDLSFSNGVKMRVCGLGAPIFGDMRSHVCRAYNAVGHGEVEDGATRNSVSPIGPSRPTSKNSPLRYPGSAESVTATSKLSSPTTFNSWRLASSQKQCSWRRQPPEIVGPAEISSGTHGDPVDAGSLHMCRCCILRVPSLSAKGRRIRRLLNTFLSR